MDEEIGNVIQLGEVDKKLWFNIIPDAKRNCFHNNFLISEKNRTVECEKCNRYFDPFHALCLIMDNNNRLATERKELTEKIVKKREELDLLDKQIMKANDRMRSLRADVGFAEFKAITQDGKNG